MVTIKVEDLLRMAKELQAEKYEYIDVDILEGDDELPPCLHIDAYDGFGGGIDFGNIDHIEISTDYKIEAELES